MVRAWGAKGRGEHGAFGIVLVLSILLTSCGIKGPPRPPEPVVPDAPRKFGVRVREGCVEMVWVAHEADETGEVAAASWEVLRAERLDPGELHAFKVIASTPDAEYIDCSLAPGVNALYMVRGVSEKGETGDSSMVAAVAVFNPPMELVNPKASGGDGFVDISWERGSELPEGAGFNVYRTQDPKRLPWKPINHEPIKNTNYSDGPLDNGVEYFYEVRAVAPVMGASPIEGPAAKMVSAVPMDNIPPSPPRGFIAVQSDTGVSLRWMMNQEDDLKGYVVFRRRRGRGKFKELFKEPVTDTAYIDDTAKKGAEYEYAVCAIDNAEPPNTSTRSEVQVVYLVR